MLVKGLIGLFWCVILTECAKFSGDGADGKPGGGVVPGGAVVPG